MLKQEDASQKVVGVQIPAPGRDFFREKPLCRSLLVENVNYASVMKQQSIV